VTALTFYTRPDCPLCLDAEDLLTAVAPATPVRVVDIEDSIALLDRYGARVPVLQRAGDEAELGWPFDETSLRAFLEGR